MNTIIIADDHPITLQGIKSYIENLGYKIIGTFTDGESLYNGILEKNPDIVITDLSMPRMNGLEVIEKLRKVNNKVKIILYTMYHEKSFLTKAKSLGVNGYILKDFAIEELSVCLEKIKNNEKWFSTRLEEVTTINKYDSEKTKIMLLTTSERKILSLITQEKSTKEIADLLFVSEKTIEKHRSNIITKLGLPNQRNILMRFALSNKDILE